MTAFRTADGRLLSYRREGAGPLLVCHGGGPGFSGQYLGALAGLGESFELVVLDPRGTGGSDRPADPRAYLIEDYVADVDELREHLGEERIRLLGHSHGGVVAAAYAAAYPGQVERLVLASTLARFDAEQVDAMHAGIEARAGEPWYADAVAALETEQEGLFVSDDEVREIALREFPLYFASFGDAEAGYLASLSDPVNGDTLRLFNTEIFTSFDLRPSLGAIAAPALVITGEDDFITGPVCAADFDAIPDRRKVVVPGCGHFIFVEAPERFADEVRSFLAASG
jgi:proline iminopeptidase